MPLSKVGIAITTHNRPDVLRETLDAIAKYTPRQFPVVVVDDGSTPPARPLAATMVRHTDPRGIPAAKNAGIAVLMDMKVDHLILLDDDTRPSDHEWWVPYVQGEEPYYTYCWTRSASGVKVPKMDELYRDSNLVAYTWSMGCLQYVHRVVIERVGGLNPVFGRGFEEHAEWAQRIHNAGFTSFVHQDHPKITGKVWAGDEHWAVARSFSSMRRVEREQLIRRNTKLRMSLADSKEFVDYR